MRANEQPDDLMRPRATTIVVAAAGVFALLAASCCVLPLALAIVGLGGAAFPSHVKLCPPKDQPVELLLINGCECEPYLTSDHRVMLEQPEKVYEGIRIELKALGIEGSLSIELEYSPEPDKIVNWVTEAYKETDRLMRAVGLRDGA